MTSAESLVHNYYAAFNAGEFDKMAELIHDEVIHDINQGAREIGRPAFVQFLERMKRCYHEELRDITLFTSSNPRRIAAEFTVIGTYLESDEGLPPASGQTYNLAAGAFFEVQDGLIDRVSNFYNLTEWLEQVSSPNFEMEQEED